MVVGAVPAAVAAVVAVAVAAAVLDAVACHQGVVVVAPLAAVVEQP